MKLILVRHGETGWVRQGRYQGSSDVPLNDRGLRQGRALASLFRVDPPFAVYSSELTRARQTAKLIGQSCGRRVRVDRRLNEVSFGRWEGKFHDQIAAQDPEAARRWYQARWSSRPPGGESLNSLKERVVAFLNELLEKFSNRSGSCVVVTHGGPIRMFLVRILQSPPNLFWSIQIDPASITTVEIGLKWKRLMLLNSQFHLNGLARRK